MVPLGLHAELEMSWCLEGFREGVVNKLEGGGTGFGDGGDRRRLPILHSQYCSVPGEPARGKSHMPINPARSTQSKSHVSRD